MESARHNDGEVPDLVTARLVLRPITCADVAAVRTGRRLPGWAEDFPAEGDRVVADLLHRHGSPTAAEAAYGHRLIVERGDEMVVGGLGFFGPPGAGRVEIGYGVVPSRRGRGIAGEAVAALVALAAADPAVHEVVASTDADNTASQRVLLRTGFTELSRVGDQAHFVLQVVSVR